MNFNNQAIILQTDRQTDRQTDLVVAQFIGRQYVAVALNQTWSGARPGFRVSNQDTKAPA